MLMTKFKNIIGRIGMKNTIFTHYTTTVNNKSLHTKNCAAARYLKLFIHLMSVILRYFTLLTCCVSIDQ